MNGDALPLKYLQADPSHIDASRTIIDDAKTGALKSVTQHRPHGQQTQVQVIDTDADDADVGSEMQMEERACVQTVRVERDLRGVKDSLKLQ